MLPPLLIENIKNPYLLRYSQAQVTIFVTKEKTYNVLILK